MKRTLLNLVYAVAVLVLVLTACAPKTSAPPVVTQPPILDAVIPPTETATSAPLVVEVGSTYPYVDGSVLVAVPAGPFLMGGGAEDNPEHTVTLSNFWIYSNEVTNQQYSLCVMLGQCSPPNPAMNPAYDDTSRLNEPVIGVDWEQADAYCRFVSGRLPTEAEWEKAARGPNGNTYPWGETTPNCDLANIGRCNPAPVSVTSHPNGRSYYGALDMAGNVFEWVGDWYSSTYYRESPAENPPGPETGDRRSVRSTSFDSNFDETESARRGREVPLAQTRDLGFRCVVENPAQFAPWCQQVLAVGQSPIPGGQPVNPTPIPVCPQVSVTSSGFCDTSQGNMVPAAHLDFGPDPLPPGWLIDYPGSCSPDATTADPTDFICTGSGDAFVQVACTLPPPPAIPGCAPGYIQVGNMCEWDNPWIIPAVCLPGVNFDPATQCCSTLPTIDDSYPLCPVNAPYWSGTYCYPWPIPMGVKESTQIVLGTCDDPHDPGSCSNPGQYTDSASCTAVGCNWLISPAGAGHCVKP